LKAWLHGLGHHSCCDTCCDSCCDSGCGGCGGGYGGAVVAPATKGETLKEAPKPMPADTKKRTTTGQAAPIPGLTIESEPPVKAADLGDATEDAPALKGIKTKTAPVRTAEPEAKNPFE
jgi:hypothetical protein